MHHIIPKSTNSISAAKKLCTNFDVHNVGNLIALPKDSNVAQKTGAGSGKTTHSWNHFGYSAAAEASMDVALRLKLGMSGCKHLAVIQAGLKAQLQKVVKQCMVINILVVLVVLKEIGSLLLEAM